MSDKPNIPLIVFDVIFLPIIILRLIVIYFFGSKYNVIGMEFLDVMFHASKQYFNQEDNVTIDVLHEDVRATIKRETKLFEYNVIEPNDDKESSKEKHIIHEIKPIATKTIATKIIASDPIIKEPQTKDPIKKLQIEQNKITAINRKYDEIQIESEKINEEIVNNIKSEVDSENTEILQENSESDSETEKILNTYTDDSEVETILKNKTNQNINFDLDVHIHKLFDDLENSMTMTQTEQVNNYQLDYSSSQLD